MELHYCEKCRRQITQAELEMGKALMLGEETYCAQCKDAVLAEMAAGAAPPAASPTQPTKITRMIRTGGRPGVSRPPTATGLRPAGGGSGGAMAPAASSRNTTIIVAVAAGVFGLVIGYLLLSSGGEAEPERWGTPPPAPPKVAAPPSSRGPGSGGARVVRSGAVGVPDDAKDANDFEPVAAPEAPSEADGVARLITAENAYEIQTAIGPKGWKILRSEEAKRFGKRGIRLTPIAEEEPRPSSDNALAIRLGRSADLSGYGKLGFWLGGRNVEKNLAEVSIVVGTEEVPLTGGKPIEYDTRWRFFSFDLAGKRDDVRGIVVRFNASVPAKPANFEVWLDDVVAYGRPGSGTAGPAVPVAPPAPPETGGETAEPVAPPRLPGPRRGPAPETEPETAGPVAPPPRRGAPAVPATPAADARVIWSENFDGAGDPSGWEGGRTEKAITHNGSPGALAATQSDGFDARYTEINVRNMPPKDRPTDTALYTAKPGVHVSFYYYLEGADQINVLARNNRLTANAGVTIGNAAQKRWTKVELDAMDFGKDSARLATREGDGFKLIRIGAGKPGAAGVRLLIDDFKLALRGGAPAATGPAAVPAGPAGDLQVLWRETFDLGDAAKRGWSNGTVQKANTYGGSAGALEAKQMPGDKYTATRISISQYAIADRSKRHKGDAVYYSDEGVYISFQYYLEGSDRLEVITWNVDQKQNMWAEIPNVVQKRWSACVINTMDIKDRWDKTGKKKTAKGDRFNEFSLLGGKAGEKGVTLIIDNFTITKGSPPRDVEAQVARAKRTVAEQTADPAKDGFYLHPRVVANLRDHYNAEKVTDGRALKVGGDSASSMSHISGIKGLSAVKRLSVCGKQKGAGDVTAKLAAELASQKPEIVTVMFGVVDLVRQRPSAEAHGHYTRIVEATLAAGAVPVLFTLPLPPTGDKDADKLVGEYNKVIMAVGRDKSVPVVDAHALVTADMANLRKYFSGTKLKKAGHDRVNKAFGDLYARLTRHVMGRQ